MAGSKQGRFRELISPFLRSKLAQTEEKYGRDSPIFQAIARQYLATNLEDKVLPHETRRHYESEITIEFEGRPIVGVERLYRRTILLEPTTVCAAHCRWCLRGQYPVKTLTRDELKHATRYIGQEAFRNDINEVLITGGDPLISLPLLSLTLEMLRENAPNIKIVRIGSRVPFHDPARISDQMLEMFLQYPEFRFEVGVNVNHPEEFWDESVDAIKRLMDIGFRVYNQNPLLKGVNDDLGVLSELYGKLRDVGIESHYLFHAIPMRGMSHHRTSLQRGLELVTALSACGEFSGRNKPRYAVLSDIGKIVLYDGVIADRREHEVLLRSGYKFADRQKWNPSWVKPDSVVLANDGTMMTWYQDGDDTAAKGFVF